VRRLGDSQRVMALSVILAIGAAAVARAALTGVPALASHTHLQWWELAIGFAATEAFAIHVDVRRDTYSISFMEVPLVLGLFFASPVAVLGGRLLGSGAALALHRRQRPIKLAFNLSLFAFETSACAVAFRAIAGAARSVGPETWAAALAAVLAANVISFAGVASVIWLHGGTLTDWRRMLGGALVPPVANTCLALGAAAVLWSEPDAVWLLGAIAAVQFVVYRAYSTLSQRYANLQRLYEFTRTAQRAASGDSAVASVLGAARALLRATTAELALLPDARGRASVSRVGADTVEIGRDVAVEDLGPLWAQVVGEGSSAIAAPNPRRGRGASNRTATFTKDAMIVPIRDGERIVGTMSVRDREGDVGTFDEADLRLFETVVNHAAVALELARTVEQLEHDALHDALTGLPNRALFNARVGEAIRAREPGTKVAVLLIDLDRFKEINDTLGHHYGDLLLGEVGARLSGQLEPGCSLARLGGDEFAVVMTGFIDAAAALDAATRIRDLLERPFPLDGLEIDVGASIGVSICPDQGEDAATLLQRADVAMYSAKKAAGVEIYSSERDHYTPQRLQMVGQLRQALESSQLELHYQPKFAFETGDVVGVEALLRWPHPDRGFIPPDEFIPIAEHTGLIRPLTVYVLHHALTQCRAWRDLGFGLHMSINVSVRNLLDPELPSALQSALARHRVDPSWLTLEITESSIMADPDQAISVLTQLAGLGLGVSVDDFGTGYSSLTYLKRLPVTELKVDKSFVRAMDRDPQDVAIVRSIIDLGANLGLTVTAEGVETREVWDHLARLGCGLAQGYYLSRPLPASALTDWLQTAQNPVGQPSRRMPAGNVRALPLHA
jgi:diguanylate cyclase (GGDEF)-like protein